MSTYERILRYWDYTGRRFLLLFAGGVAQLSPPSGEACAQQGPHKRQLRQLHLQDNLRAGERAWAGLLGDLRSMQCRPARTTGLDGGPACPGASARRGLAAAHAASPKALFLAATRQRAGKIFGVRRTFVWKSF